MAVAVVTPATTAERALSRTMSSSTITTSPPTPPWRRSATSLDTSPRWCSTTAANPALRENFHLGDSSFRTNLMANQAAFTQAKSSTLKPGQSPPLQLIPEECFQANPTDRSVIEGFHEELEPNSFRGALLCGDCTVAHSRRCVGLSNGLRPVGVSAVLPKVLPVAFIQIIFGDVHSKSRRRPHHAQISTMIKAEPSSVATSRSMIYQAVFTQAKPPTLEPGKAPIACLAAALTSRPPRHQSEILNIMVTDNNNVVFFKTKRTCHRLDRFKADLARK